MVPGGVTLPPLPEPAICHVMGWYGRASAFGRRFELFLESIDEAERRRVRHIGLSAEPQGWSRPGWDVVTLARDARSVGDPLAKPFLKDLLDEALDRAGPSEWILYTNSDLGLAPDTYTRLLAVRGSAVEYMRKDVDAAPQTLDELFTNPGELYRIGLDGFALRASLYAAIRDSIPDFVIGEPHWDTALSEILRRLVPVRRDTVSLFHPRHEQAWDMGNPTPAGRHNEELFVTALIQGSAPGHRITDEPDCTDTAVVVTSFGADQLRSAANTEGLRRQLRQDLYADVYLVELLLEGEESCFPADVLAEVTHVVVRGDDACRGLFQKEALLNVGWRRARAESSYTYFLFVDADVFATDLAWWSSIRDRLRENPNRAVQGFRLVTDPADGAFDRASVAALFLLDHQTDLLPNPGVAWGLHGTVLERGDGFNPLCIDCGGDSAFVTEYLNGPEETYDPWLLGFRWFGEVARDLPIRAIIDCVPVDLTHVAHGPAVDRNYQEVRYAIDGFPPIRDLVELGPDGLLRWRDPACPERRLLELRSEMRSRDDVDRLFSEHGYARRAAASPSFPGLREKPLAMDERAAAPGAAASPSHATPDRFAVFDPHEVFRREWPFSWCQNVEGAGATRYAPLAENGEHPVLRLRRVDRDEPIVVALATRPTWTGADLGAFGSLELTVLAEDGEHPEVTVWLTGEAHDGTTPESTHVSLGSRGLREGRSRSFSISLRDLVEGTPFDLSRTRQVVVVGHGCGQLELSRVAAVQGRGDGALVAEPLPTAIPSRSREARGRVGIEAGTVLSDRGERLRGVPVWLYKWGTVTGLSDHVQDPEYYAGLGALGVNSIRLVCFDAWQRSHGYPHYAFDTSAADRAQLLEQLDGAIDAATRSGLHVLVNYHDTGRLDVDHCRRFWELVAGRYADWGNVFYELANEPVPWCPCDWDEDALAAQQLLLATVRDRAPETHVVLCSFANTNDEWKPMVEVVDALDVDWSKASVGFHCYQTGGTSAPILATRDCYPVICTEVDVPVSAGGDANVVPMDGEDWPTQTLERLGISWFAWRANGPDELERHFRGGFLAEARRAGYDWTAGG